MRFNDWEYDPAHYLVGFSLEENRFDKRAYVLPNLKYYYDVYVGVRKKESTSFDRGEYKLMFGPYQLATQPYLTQTLTNDELTVLGNDCIELTAFGIAKENGKTVTVTKAFNPTSFGHDVAIFNSSVICAPNDVSKDGK